MPDTLPVACINNVEALEYNIPLRAQNGFQDLFWKYKCDFSKYLSLADGYLIFQVPSTEDITCFPGEIKIEFTVTDALGRQDKKICSIPILSLKWPKK